MNLRLNRTEEIHPYRLIDLFSGAGGMTLGFVNSSPGAFQTVWANDIDQDAAATYNLNFGEHCIVGDIGVILSDPKRSIPEADVVIGGPPCQGFSLLNKGRKKDPRKRLWKPFLQVIERSGASVFVMENVPQILGSEEYEEIVLASKALGFNIASGKLCAADYGVPQVRWRGFIVGCRFANLATVLPPPPTHRLIKEQTMDSDDLSPWRTVRDAIEDLPPPKGKEMRELPPPLDLHFGRSPTQTSLARYMAIPEEGMNRFDLQRIAPELTPGCWIRKTSGGTDLFGRLWWDRPAFTIRTEFYKPEKGRYLHPSQHRPITHREAARLQSFPDSFLFAGSKIQVAKQIGNAVPPLLAAAIAKQILGLLALRFDGDQEESYAA